MPSLIGWENAIETPGVSLLAGILTDDGGISGSTGLIVLRDGSILVGRDGNPILLRGGVIGSAETTGLIVLRDGSVLVGRDGNPILLRGGTIGGGLDLDDEFGGDASVPGFGPELLRVPIGAPSVAWQTPVGILAASLRITSPVAVPWRVVCLSRTNLSMGATIRVRAGAYDSGIISAGVAYGIGQALHVLPTEISAAMLQIDISDPTNPDAFLNIPLAYAGSASFKPWIAPASSDGLDVRRADTQTRGGTVLTSNLSAARSWQITMATVRDSDSPLIDALSAAAAAGRNVLFVPRIGHTRAAAEAIFGLLSSGRRGFLSRVGNFRSWTATISERL